MKNGEHNKPDGDVTWVRLLQLLLILVAFFVVWGVLLWLMGVREIESGPPWMIRVR